MASSVYNYARQGFLDGSINWMTGTFKAMLVSALYTPNINVDEYVSAIPSSAIVARSATLATLSDTLGRASAANVTIPAVSGPQVAYVVIYQDTGTDSTSRLVAYIGDGNGLPATPTGGDITIAWDTGPNGIFQL